MAAPVIYHLNVQEKQNKEWSFVHRTTFIVLYCVDSQRWHCSMNFVFIAPSLTRKQIPLCFKWLHNAATQKQNNAQDAAHSWATESLTFLFQWVKYIPLCQEELLAFIIFCKERFKVQSTNYLFLSTIPTWYWKQPLILFLQTKLFFTEVCKNPSKSLSQTAITTYKLSAISGPSS